MKNPRLLSALLGGILGGTTMMVVIGLFNLNAIAAVPLNRSFFLPHLAMAGIVHDPMMQDLPLAFIVPALLLGHAAAVLLAALVAGIVNARARESSWAAPLAFGLGGPAFYVAHFCFLHPGDPGAATGIGVRILDYVAIAALAVGAWNLLRFALLFPVRYDPAAFNAFAGRQLQRQQAVGASSKFALRRWLNRKVDTRSLDRLAKFRRRELAFVQSRWMPASLAALGWLLLLQLEFVRGRGMPAFFTKLITAYTAFLVLVIALGFAWSVLEWHRREADPPARQSAATIWRGVTFVFWTVVALMGAGLVALFSLQNATGISLFVLMFPVGVVAVATAFVISVAFATRSAPRAAAP